MADKDELLDHEYDGIKEYDNDLPRWWLALFWGGILFGFVYVGYYHYGGGEFTSEKLASEMKLLDEKREAALAAVPDEDTGRAALIKLASNQEALAGGEEIYIQKCAACHLDKGQGLVGPNLTDDYWLHGSDITDIRKVIVDGVIEKGMIAWGPLLKPEEVNQITAFVWSLHGTNPPNPKEPQGELIERAKLEASVAQDRPTE